MMAGFLEILGIGAIVVTIILAINISNAVDNVKFARMNARAMRGRKH